MPTARQHTIILHGGSRGAKSSKTDLALKHYRAVLENRMKCIMGETAIAVFNWQVPGRSIKDDDRPRWSGAFRANWQVKFGGDAKSGWKEDVAPARYPTTLADRFSDDTHEYEYAPMIDLAKSNFVRDYAAGFRNATVDTPIYIGNVSPYAHWLNNGGAMDYGTFLVVSPGYRFMEACEAFIRNNVDSIIDRGLAAAAKKPARG